MWRENVCSDFKKLTYQLKQLISVTSNTYEILYLAFLKQLKHALKNQSMFIRAFTHTIDILKIRRGVMLPIGADAETCYQQQEIWTYAIFTAVLLKISNITNIESILPSSGLIWLKSYPAIFEHWSNYLSDNIDKTNFILRVAEKLKTEEIKKEVETVNKIVLPNEDISTNISEPMVTQNIADHFISWLTQSIQMNTFSFNQTSSCLHYVSEGLFILMPATLELFIKNTLPHKSIFKKLDNTKARRKYIRNLLQELMQANFFIQSVSNNNLLKGLLIQNNVLPEITKILSDLSISVRTDLQIKLFVTDVR